MTKHPIPPDSASVSSDAEACRLDERLDEALAETFPASDPVAVTPSRPRPERRET
jgi:hypothetical protein